MNDFRWSRLAVRAACTFLALGVVRWAAPAWCGQDAEAWYRGDQNLVRALAAEQVEFEADDSVLRDRDPDNRYVGEWALVTHQMTALGLGQTILAHPDWKATYAKPMRDAALRSFLPEMRDFGTQAWHGEDALESLASDHGHAYLAYSALAVGMARWVEPTGFPPDVARAHDALIAAYVRRLAASPSALIETYPGEAYPTDIAAVAAAIAVHGRATGEDHHAVLAHWARGVREHQRDAGSGFVHQRMGASGHPHDVPRGSGTGLAAYYTGFVDRGLAAELTQALVDHERTCFGFGGVAEFAERDGHGDIDSGPVVLGVSVAATGFTLGALRANHTRLGQAAFTRIFRTTALFGLPTERDGTMRFRSGGPIGNSLLLAMLTALPLDSAATGPRS